MSQYYISINEYFENGARQLLKKYLSPDYSVERNNLSSNDIDLKVCDNSGNTLCTIDVQYSLDFAKYGDARIDLMSAGQLINNKHKTVKELNQQIANSTNHLQYFKSLFQIDKDGKFFVDGNDDLLGVIYYFYNDTFEKVLGNFKNKQADCVFFIPKRVILEEVRVNPNLIIKINDKESNNIYESHYSAFICLNVAYLCKRYDIPLFKTRNEMELDFKNLFESELSYL